MREYLSPMRMHMYMHVVLKYDLAVVGQSDTTLPKYSKY